MTEVVVVSGEPSDDELAALVAVLSGRSRGAVAADAETSPERTAWSDPARRLRQPVHPGPAGWRRLNLPR